MGRLGLFIFLWGVTGFGCGEQKMSEAPKKLGVKDYLARAYSTVDTLHAAEAIERNGAATVVFVDVREGDEIERDGRIPGSMHVARGVLEFYMDETSSLHNDIFSSEKRLVFYCETGGRSVLAARLAMDMGLEDVAYLGGGFTAWANAGGTVEQKDTGSKIQDPR